MNRIEEKFSVVGDGGRSALICYLTAGDPSIELTRDIVLELEKNGADIIELGIPFSDPMADGPTIQLASERALANGTTIHDVIKLSKELREHSEIPIILFGYYNPFFAYGLEKFAKDAKEAGVDGILVVDLPPEESEEFKKHLDKNDLNLIFLLAPTSTEKRIDLVSDNAGGFIYLVSVTGVTGARPGMEYSLSSLTKDIKVKSGIPVGIGFGVSTPKQAKDISQYADAVIVGSALVRIIEKNGKERDALLKEIGQFTHSLSSSCFKN